MSDRQRGKEREVPVGLEKLLYTAAIDPAFREALLRDRERAAEARGLVLSSSERSMLRLASAQQLASSIDALDTSETNLARRGFLGAVAGAVTLAAGSALSGCNEVEQTAGIRPREAGLDYPATRGIQPDLPQEGLQSGGIRPDDVGPDLPRGIDSAGIRPDDLGDGSKTSDGK